MGLITWQGTDPEFARLLQAVDRNCECVLGTFGLPSKPCPPHAMLKSQSTLDHLLYVYRTRAMFIRRELYALPSPSGRKRGVAYSSASTQPLA